MTKPATIAALLYLFGIAAARGEPCSFPAHADIPLELAADTVFVAASVNGQPVKLKVGLSTTATVLWPETADRLHLRRERTTLHAELKKRTESSGEGSQQVPLLLSYPVDLVIGRMTTSRTRVTVAEFPAEVMHGSDGLLGFDLLSRYDVDFALKDNKLTL